MRALIAPAGITFVTCVPQPWSAGLVGIHGLLVRAA